MQIIINLFYFLLAIGILVTFHEWGHFWVARRCGVKVLTFSIGFGPVIWSRTGKDDICYQIAAIPLGGYVRMLDSRESEVNPADLPQAFDQQTLWKRIAVVLAGPVANFILAFALYWLVFTLGITGLNTKVGAVIGGSLAAEAGIKPEDQILSVDGTEVRTASELIRRLALRLGEEGEVEVQVRREGHSQPILLKTALKSWHIDPHKDNLLHSFGIRHYREVQPALISEVQPGEAADKAGIRGGDRITRFDDEEIADWNQLVKLIVAHPGKHARLTILRDGELRSINVVIGERAVADRTQGFLGIGINSNDSYRLLRAENPFSSLFMAARETASMLSISAGLFLKLVSGELSLSSLSGPVAIAEGAGGSAGIGLVYFVSFLAMISVNLGFINLLPVPVLDGGHLLYFVIEGLKGKPLSEEIQQFGFKIGMMLVMAMMAVAIINDFVNL